VKRLNLATRPFRNRRLLWLLLAFVDLVLLLVTAFHVKLVFELRPRSTFQSRRELENLERQHSALDAEIRSLKRASPTSEELVEWQRLQELVDARVFPWVSLFARLGEALPAGTRLTSIAPDVDKGEVMITIDAIARSPEDAFETVRSLEARPEFDRVYMRSATQQNDGIMAQLVLRYLPLRSGRAASRASTDGKRP
jgi:Tfp pilus assembly protein PilN